MDGKWRVLSIGHSYVVAMNRTILREIAGDDSFDITVVAPSRFHGSLRTLSCETEPSGSKIRLLPVDAYLTQKMHIFTYNHFQLAKIFAQPFDVLHLWEEPYIFSGFQVARMAVKAKVPYSLYTTQSLVKKYPQPFRFLEKKVFQWSDRWIACGRQVYEAMDEKGWDGANKGKVLPLAVDTDRFQPLSEVEKQKSQGLLGLKGPIIGFLGRLTEEKGCEVLMRALEKIKHKSWSLFMMGSGPYESEIKRWAVEQGLADRVKVQLYSHEEVPKMLPVCDLLVCPSQTRNFWKEQFGRMLVEAFAAGVPVIGSDSGEIPYVLGDSGRIVPEANVDEWASAIEALLDDGASLRSLRSLGIERAKMFSAKNIATQYKEFYREIATGKKNNETRGNQR